MDIKVGDRVEVDSGVRGEVVAILNPDVPFPIVVQVGRHEEYYTENELGVIS